MTTGSNRRWLNGSGPLRWLASCRSCSCYVGHGLNGSGPVYVIFRYGSSHTDNHFYLNRAMPAECNDIALSYRHTSSLPAERAMDWSSRLTEGLWCVYRAFGLHENNASSDVHSIPADMQRRRCCDRSRGLRSSILRWDRQVSGMQKSCALSCSMRTGVPDKNCYCGHGPVVGLVDCVLEHAPASMWRAHSLT